jgi:hypothetical protein
LVLNILSDNGDWRSAAGCRKLTRTPKIVSPELGTDPGSSSWIRRAHLRPCSAYQAIDAKSRNSRSSFVCTNCGSIFDVDVNAAKNILKLGSSQTGERSGIACESSQTAGPKQEEVARESERSALEG